MHDMDPIIETFHCIAMILFTGFEFEAKNSNAQLMAVNDCTCQGYNLVYECSVTGGQATVWTGTIFDCSSSNNEVVIFHSINSTLEGPQVCNNRDITGRVIRDANGIYTFQLTVRVSAEINGSTIVVLMTLVQVLQ